jgi:hypothetical protein
MKKIIFAVPLLFSLISFSQVSEMKWELDYQILLKMANDSDYTYDIREVFHVTDAKNTDFTSEFVFYPVNPGESYTNELLQEPMEETSYKTLWSALHSKLDGGWIHFANCIAYALETQSLNLKEPIMKRPETDWKPDPVTESWKRTHKWEYYIPVLQKNAIKEYKLRKKNNELGDLKSIPASYINLFLSTSDKEYSDFQSTGNFNEIAKIDLIKVLLGANYLGEDQIKYVSNAVLNAVKGYSSSNLPSVLIFDEFEAAAAMSLDAGGYKLESIVFRSSAELSQAEMETRKEEVSKIIETINAYNKAAFQKRLKSYYGE